MDVKELDKMADFFQDEMIRYRKILCKLSDEDLKKYGITRNGARGKDEVHWTQFLVEGEDF